MGKSLVLKVLDKQNNLSEFSLLAFIFFVFLLSSLVFPQIIIKEKVEINPQTINPEYQISALDPCPGISRPQYYQSVYSCSGFPIEPYQQLYPFQSGTFIKFSPTTLYEAEIISGSDYAYFERVEYIDSIGNFYPYETFGTLLSGLTGAELSGTGDYIGYEGPGIFERENSSVYRVRFDNYSIPEASVTIRIKNLNNNTFTDWHTLIVNPELQFTDQQNADTLLHYYSTDVTPVLRNVNFPCSHPGYGGCPPEDVTFNIEITEGQQYGSIKKELTGEVSTSFTGIPFNELYQFTYYANGVQPDSTATVRILHSSSDAELIPIEYEYTVKRNTVPPPSEGGSIYVKMDKKVVIPGDTINVQLRWIDEVGDTIDFLPMQRFRVDLAEGSEYGTILDILTADTSDTFTEITNEFKVITAAQIEPQQAKIILVAEADLMIFTRPVRINSGTRTAKQIQESKVDKNDEQGGNNTDFIIIGNHLVGVGEITITKTPFVVEIIPSIVSAGDTAQIIPMELNPDGTTSPFDSLQTFELGILDGCALGYLSAQADSNNYFYGVTQPIYFIADSTADSGIVKLRVGLIETTAGNKSNKGRRTTEEGEYCFLNTFESIIYRDADLKVEKKYEILLGETKYYQARYSDIVAGKLVIDELSGPNLWNGGIALDVWGENPVTILEGDKLGVYWEKEKPVWSGTTITGNLAKGLIRLVGRYLEEGKTYKVKLTARTQNGDEASIVIEVKKPNKLGNNVTIVKDVFGNDLNIDELCIKWGGKLGIPPQFIKGQMRRETSSHYPFYPTYLYEPWTTQFNAFKDNQSLFNNPFYIQENATSFNPPTPNHSNVKDYHYPTEPVSVWDMIEKYSTIVYTSPPGGLEKYGKRKVNGELYFYRVYTKPQKKFNELQDDAYNKYEIKNNPSKKTIANNEARENFIKFFRDEWNGGISGNNKGLKNIKAQTRIAASYGLLQMMYPTAIGGTANYPVNSENLPEELLETENIKWAFNHLTYFINNALKSQIDKNGNWQEGLEGTYLNRIWKLWNKYKPSYPEEVLGFSNNYKPGK